MLNADKLKTILADKLLHPPSLDTLVGELIPAAVLILLYNKGCKPHVVLTQRTHTVSHHRGQISLPGGKWDTDDHHLIHTALRECHEEVGVWPENVTVWGCLPPMPTVSHFWVTPVVGWLAEVPLFQINPDEIEVLIEVPLAALMEASRWRQEQRWFQGTWHQVHYFDYQPHMIWGITGQILYDFVALLG